MKAEQTLKKNTLSNLMEKLAGFEPQDAPFITIYLNAEPNERGRDFFQAFLKTEMSEAAKDYSDESEQSLSFKQDAEKILTFLDEKLLPQANGAAIFACAKAGFFRTAQFTTPVANNRFFVYDRPHIYPMARMIEQNPRFVVVFADTNKADVYIFGGETETDARIEQNAQVEEIQNVKTQHQQQGGWSQMRFQRRVENFHKQHAKEVVETLEKLVRDEEIEMVVLSGDEAVIIPLLRAEMSKHLDEKVVGVLSLNQYASEQELHDAAFEVVREYDAVRDREEVGRMIGAKESSGLGCTGVSATLAALSNGQVEELLIVTDPQRIRYDEDKVEKILENYAPGDDNSLTDAPPDTSETRQILDELIIRAFNSAARIRFIEDAELLAEYGGVGAIFRYKIEGQEQIVK